MLDVSDNRKLSLSSPWTEEKVVRLRKMHAAGTGYPVIADELGVSKNAIAGKVLRLGLDKRKNASKRNDGGAMARRLSGKNGNTDRAATLRMARKLWDIGPKLRKGKPPKEVAIPMEFLGIALLDLESSMCRYPRGEGLTITFCGQKVVSGESWCRHCYRIVYQAPKPRVERPYLPLGGSKPRVI